jgi:cob(I)alamin adenosyltransferase
MTELSTGSEARMSLVPGSSAVSEQMVTALEHELDRLRESSEMPAGFVLPGEAVLSASLDFARTVVRRAERRVLPIAVDGSMVIAYLNRLSDLLWALARDSEGQPRLARSEEATDPPSI